MSIGRPRAISPRSKRRIIRLACNSTLTARQITVKAGVDTAIRNVRNIVAGAKYLKRRKLQRKPPLTEKHKLARMAFAENHLRWKKKWRRVIFTDEKKFNLDGPDGFSYYFHDLRKEVRVLSKRQFGDGSIMVWAAIAYNGRSAIRFLSGKIDSSRYVQMLRDEFIDNLGAIAGQPFISQQDNAAIHSAKVYKQFFQQMSSIFQRGLLT